MRDVHGGDAELALQPLQLEAHALAQLGIQVRKRLVEQQQRRLHDERARERQALLLPAGELGGLAVGHFVERHYLEHAQDAFSNFLPGKAFLPHLKRKGGVVEHGHVRPDGVGLEHHAEPAPVWRHEHVSL